MKKFLLGLALIVTLVFYAAPILACSCDTATGILMGVPDRLHEPWPGDPEKKQEKMKNPENGPKQEVQPLNQDVQPKGEVNK